MKIAIVSPDIDVVNMFEQNGNQVMLTQFNKADLLVFTGGSDVYPQFYKQNRHPRTFINIMRDEYEKKVFENALANNIPMVGICRGGQLLNILSGGSMFQDVNNHAIYGTHKVFDATTETEVDVTSTHHQMMRPSNRGEVLAYAKNLATYKEYMDGKAVVRVKDDPQDVEVVFYEHTRCLCFQPHPEFDGFFACRELFFRYIQTYLLERN